MVFIFLWLHWMIKIGWKGTLKKKRWIGLWQNPIVIRPRVWMVSTFVLSKQDRVFLKQIIDMLSEFHERGRFNKEIIVIFLLSFLKCLTRCSFGITDRLVWWVVFISCCQRCCPIDWNVFFWALLAQSRGPLWCRQIVDGILIANELIDSRKWWQRGVWCSR